MEHAVAAYSVRCYDKLAGRRSNDRYHKLGRIGSYDLLNLFHEFCLSKKGYSLIDESKQAYRILLKKYEPAQRFMSGWIEYGHYGMKSNIVNLTSNAVDFEKKPDNADMARYYFLFWIPAGDDKGIAIFHTIRGDGVKSIFHKEFTTYFQRYADRTLSINSLTFDSVLQSWANADTKEIVALRLNRESDIANIPLSLGNVHTSFVIKPQRNGMMSKLGRYIKNGTPESDLVEQLDDMCDDIKVRVELNGKKKTFRIGKKRRKGHSEVEIPDDEVEFKGGVPEFASLNKWAFSLLKDFKSELHKIL